MWSERARKGSWYGFCLNHCFKSLDQWFAYKCLQFKQYTGNSLFLCVVYLVSSVYENDKLNFFKISPCLSSLLVDSHFNDLAEYRVT